MDHKRRFSSGRVYINGLEGFWSYAKERIIKFHGVSKEKFPLHLKQTEFWYNNWHHNLLNALTISTRCYVLELGRIARSGIGKDLLADERVKTAYLGL